MKQVPNKERSGAPALTRGLMVLERLARHGASSLEHLSRATGLPKTSVLRLLAALEWHGAVVRNPHDKRDCECPFMLLCHHKAPHRN
ncbi:MAG: helix-turn-helix domain-containing protein [Chitinivibrionales bacterium]|nr:helix-turn-helix domain-containing protein [Chitinivibrionales bacterium]MBD3355578.1 helix-turn-helix domain-containing protein [Chitinivibrionales bacterium]